MGFKLQSLEYQEEILRDIMASLGNAEVKHRVKEYQNPVVVPDETVVEEVSLAEKPRLEFCVAQKKGFLLEPDNGTIIDIKMETGTGKTYVYTRLMFELYKKYGINKFVIVVPSVAIMLGTRNFLVADTTWRHCNEIYSPHSLVDENINVSVYTPDVLKSGGNALRDFVQLESEASSTISCLLINNPANQMRWLDKKNPEKSQYALGLDYFHPEGVSPLEQIAMTRPVVIIDEPHRFNRAATSAAGAGAKHFQVITQMNPQLIFRFGATFSELDMQEGKRKWKEKDYCNLVVDLDSVKAINQQLIKGINVHTIGEVRSDSVVFTLIAINRIRNSQKVKNYVFKQNKNSKEYVIEQGGSLDELDKRFPRSILDIDGMRNGVTDLHEGMKFDPFVADMVYQEQLMQTALDKHFQQEKHNWLHKEGNKVKTLSLFFIDSVADYRDNDGWIKQIFEKLLKKQLEKTIHELETEILEYENNFSDLGNYRHREYLNFLENSLENISSCHAGYFSGDKASKDEAIRQEVEDILNNKEKLTKIRDDNESFILPRFLFSVWALKEGWDNPNVFVIAKLRSSGSEISKIQEVGRGLRRPVDIFGNRLMSTTEDFRLDYIVDRTEADFADKLIEEINPSGPYKWNKWVREVMTYYKCEPGDSDMARSKLRVDGIIDKNDMIINQTEFERILGRPLNAEATRAANNGVWKNPKTTTPMIRLRKENWNKIRDLWLKITQRYMIIFNELDRSDYDSFLAKVLTDSFVDSTIAVGSSAINTTVQGDRVEQKYSTGEESTLVGIVPYGQFLKILHLQTHIPVHDWHYAMINTFPEGISAEKFNGNSIDNIVKKFTEIFSTTYEELYTYNSLDYTAATSVMKANGEFFDEIPAKTVGREYLSNHVSDNYLYDEERYDSSNEKAVLGIRVPETVKVFGKLPTKSVKVPTYMGNTTSPDFIYAMEDKKGNTRLALLVEVKPDLDNQRNTDKRATLAQRKFFEENFGEDVQWIEITEAKEVERELKKLF